MIAIHLVVAVSALVIGPVALSARKGSRLHRAFGYAWVTLMLGAALSSLFIRRFDGANWHGFTPIHLLAVATFAGIGAALWHVSRRNIVGHRSAMWSTYLGGCMLAGAFALLLPGRLLGGLFWQQVLG